MKPQKLNPVGTIYEKDGKYWEVFLHMPDKNGILREMIRETKPKG